MSKQLEFDSAARAALRRGVNKLTDAVDVTLGPRGRSVVLDRKFGAPTVTNDGATIAKEIELPDPYENLGASPVTARPPPACWPGPWWSRATSTWPPGRTPWP